MTLKKKILKHKFIAAAFFLPLLIMTAAFAVHDIFPFGGDQIAVIDLYHQYLPLISELQHKLHTGGSLFFTWNGMGGCNFWNIIAYQAGSPLNLLLILFPEKYIMEGLTFILLVKIGLAGSFMYIFLKEACPANGFTSKPPVRISADTATVAFSTLYALNAYVMAYYWNIMWMDAVALFPLCMLGLRRVTDGGRGILYSVSLALIVIANYYIAIMVCIFIMLYYLAYYFERKRVGKIKGFLITTARAVFYSGLGLAMSGLILVPTYYSMKNSSAVASTFPEDTFIYKDAWEVTNQLLPNAKLSYLEGLPNVYCGMAVVILLIFYYASRSVPVREKLVNSLLLVLLFFSLNVNVLDYIWHGLHYPNQLPFRYSFMVCFLLIVLAYRTFRRIDEINGKYLGVVLGAGIVYYLMAQRLLKDVVDDANLFFYLGILWLALFSLLFMGYKRELYSFRALKYMLIILITAEMTVGAITDMERIGQTSKETYDEKLKSMEELIEQTRDEFARVEIDDALTINEPARLHYMGLSQFSSSMNTNTCGFMEAMGLEARETGNRSVYRPSDPVTNAIFNVKYMISKYGDLEDSDFTKIAENDDSSLYENKYPLAMGYMCPDSIYSYGSGSTNPFDNLNEYVNKATGGKCGDVLYSAGDYSISGENARVVDDYFGDYSAEIVDESKECGAKLSFTVDETQKYYVFVDCATADSVIMQKSGEVNTTEIEENYSGIVNAGIIKAGQSVDIEITFESGGGGEITGYIYYLDQEEWDRAYSIMSKRTLDVKDFDDTHVKGSVDAGNGGVLVTSIPYDRGWKIYVDGKEKRADNLVDDAMIAIPLEKGTHEIEMKFLPEGFMLGLLISLLSAVLLAAASILYGRIRRARDQ